MPAEFTPAEVAAIAELAHLELTAEEIDMLARQLGEILAYANEVQQVDTRSVPPTASVLVRAPADRPDEVRPSLSPETALLNAPDPGPDSSRISGLFRVPRVIG
jgi:aspartyl-tRNA(Asn)/glutamyl-tRNA(Gln) amidotransferase subunit C